MGFGVAQLAKNQVALHFRNSNHVHAYYKSSLDSHSYHEHNYVQTDAYRARLSPKEFVLVQLGYPSNHSHHEVIV